MLLWVTPLGLTLTRAGMARSPQAGENLTVDKGGKELIALHGGVLGRGFGIDGVHVQPRAPCGKNVLGLRAAVRAGAKSMSTCEACIWRVVDSGVFCLA